MFYGDDSVLLLIKCQLCKAKPTEAKILPCDIFCNNCVDELTKGTNEETKEFICKSCHETHTIPKNGFKTWKALNEFYSKELSSEEINRDETAEKLNKNLLKIQDQINRMNFTLINKVDVLKEHCLKLRNEVDSYAEIAIKQTQHVRNEMLQEIENYQTKCLFNMETDKTQVQKSTHFLNELKDFNQEWNVSLDRYQMNKADMVKANEIAFGLEQRFKKEDKDLEKLIFIDRPMIFRKSKLKIENNFLGIFDAIDLYQLRMVKFSDIMIKGSRAQCFGFDLYKDGKIAITYSDKSGKLCIAILVENFKFIKSMQTAIYIDAVHSVKLKTVNDFLIFTISHECSFRDDLVLVNSNLEQVNTNEEIGFVNSFYGNEENIYCLEIKYQSNVCRVVINIFDYQLNQIEQIGQGKDPNQPFYFTTKVRQLCCRERRFFLLYQEKIDIIDESTGLLLNSIPVGGNQMAFDSEFNLVVLCISSSKLFKHNLESDLTDEIKLENVTETLEFFINQGNQIVYLDKSLKCLFFE